MLDSRGHPSDSRNANPLNQSDGLLACGYCQLIYHGVKDCPHNKQGGNSEVTFFTQEVGKRVPISLRQTLDLSKWLKCYF